MCILVYCWVDCSVSISQDKYCSHLYLWMVLSLVSAILTYMSHLVNVSITSLRNSLLSDSLLYKIWLLWLPEAPSYTSSGQCDYWTLPVLSSLYHDLKTIDNSQAITRFILLLFHLFEITGFCNMKLNILVLKLTFYVFCLLF